MTIEKLEEFASNGDKHLAGLDVATGFPRADKPERPWFNKLFGDITGKINEVVDNIDELPPFEGGVLADTFVVVDGTLSQRTINKGLESIADLSTINNPKDGLRVYVKSYHAGLGKGGGYFTYDSSGVSINDGGMVFNGWVRDNKQKTVLDYGAKADGVSDDRDAIQRALESLVSGETLYIPDGDYKIVNAVGTGATVFEQRQDAVNNNKLSPLTCETSNVTLVIDGLIKPTTILGDLLVVTGEETVVTGSGGFVGTGEFNDYNAGASGAEAWKQWRASLLKLDGASCKVQGLRFENPPAVGLRVMGVNSIVSGCTFKGGAVEHGSGTFLMSILADSTAFHCLIEGNQFVLGDNNEAAYTDVYCDASRALITGNVFSGGIEHSVYAYGRDVTILNNTMNSYREDAGGAIQIFNSGCMIVGNRIDGYYYGGGWYPLKISSGTAISLKRANGAVIQDNYIISGKGSSIASTDFVGVDNLIIEDIVIKNNFIVTHSKQSPIQIVGNNTYRNLTIEGNIVDWTKVAVPNEINPNNEDFIKWDDYTGTAVIDQSPLRIQTLPTADNSSSNISIKGNKFYGGPKETFMLRNIDNCTVEGNIFRDAGNVFGNIGAVTGLTFDSNVFEETRNEPKITYLFSESGQDELYTFKDNHVRGLKVISTTRILTKSTLSSTTNMFDGDPCVGVFNINDVITSSKVQVPLNNAFCRNNAHNPVEVIPLNEKARAIQNSSKALTLVKIAALPDNETTYVLLTTSDKTALTPEEIGTGIDIAKFMYKIYI